jgi:hypothetical protein
MKLGSSSAPGSRSLFALVLASLTACASAPPPPDWQADASAGLDRALEAYLSGDSRAAALELERSRREIARTGRPELMARAELVMCAARVASLVFEPCEGFERLREDAQAPELAYADHLAGRVLPAQGIERLPPAQRSAAASIASAAAGGDVSAIDDPLARLIAAAVLFHAGKAGPHVVAAAADAASARGWRRPLLAWLEVQRLLAERSGDAQEARRLQRRISLVQAGR